MEQRTSTHIVESNPKTFIDRRWFAALDLSIAAVAVIVKIRKGFGMKFPFIVVSPFAVTSTAHYFDVLPSTTHFVSGVGYSLLIVHSLILRALTIRRNVAYNRYSYYPPLLLGIAGINFYQAIKRW